MAEALNEVSVSVGGALKCQVFISNQHKVLNLMMARNNVMEVVKDFLPADSFIFTKRVGDQAIPVATGKENVVSLDKCRILNSGDKNIKDLIDMQNDWLIHFFFSVIVVDLYLKLGLRIFSYINSI